MEIKKIVSFGLDSFFLLIHSNRSSLDTGVEESVNVNDVLEEAPLLLSLGLSLGVNLSVGSNLDSLGLIGGGSEGNNSSNDDFLEHFVGETNSGAKSSSFAVFIALTGVLCSTAGASSAMFSCALTVFKSLKSFCLSAMSDTPCLG